MLGHSFTFCDQQLVAMPSGALWLPAGRVLTVSDLHLGKPDRILRAGGALIPPYDIAETLGRLSLDIATTNPLVVICLGDSFDDLTAAGSLSENERLSLLGLQAGRRWVWIEGNHDPGPVDLGGSHLSEYRAAGLVWRHIATSPEKGEISGHYHPKYALAGQSRPAFLYDNQRVILPAYGAYTGGMHAGRAPLAQLMGPEARVVLTGPKALVVPLRR